MPSFLRRCGVYGKLETTRLLTTETRMKGTSYVTLNLSHFFGSKQEERKLAYCGEIGVTFYYDTRLTSVGTHE